MKGKELWPGRQCDRCFKPAERFFGGLKEHALCEDCYWQWKVVLCEHQEEIQAAGSGWRRAWGRVYKRFLVSGPKGSEALEALEHLPPPPNRTPREVRLKLALFQVGKLSFTSPHLPLLISKISEALGTVYPLECLISKATLSLPKWGDKAAQLARRAASRKGRKDMALAITDEELYAGIGKAPTLIPGLASPHHGAAVLSLSHPYLGSVEGVCREAVHEVGHLFGMEDCGDPACVMSERRGILEEGQDHGHKGKSESEEGCDWDWEDVFCSACRWSLRWKALERRLAKISSERIARAVMLRLGFYDGDGLPLSLREVGERLGWLDDPRRPLGPERARHLVCLGVDKLVDYGWDLELARLLKGMYGLAREPVIYWSRSLSEVVREIRKGLKGRAELGQDKTSSTSPGSTRCFSKSFPTTSRCQMSGHPLSNNGPANLTTSLLCRIMAII